MAAALSLGRLAVSTVAAGCVNTIRCSLFVLSSTVRKKENGRSRIDEEERERSIVDRCFARNYLLDFYNL